MLRPTHLLSSRGTHTTQVPDENGRPAPFRLAYSRWLTDWVTRLDPNAPDELLILARGKT